MGAGTSYSMMEARHSVMLLGEEFGIHLPRALSTFIASLGPIGPALEAAFPFLAVAVGATLLIEHLAKMHEAGMKLTDDQVRFGTSVQNAFNALDQKMTEAKIRADELRNDHLGALKLQLDLIDRQSMAELVRSFEEVAKAADIVMKDLEGHWYTWGKGSDGAQAALNAFQLKYNSLLAQGKTEEASGLLTGTLKQAQEVLTALQNRSFTPTGNQAVDNAAYARATASAAVLEKYNVSIGMSLKDQAAAQQTVVDALNTQVGLQQRGAELNALDKGNASKTTGNAAASQAAAAAREAAESKLRMGEQTLAGEKATADAELSIHRASLEERLKSDLDFAARERDVQLAANAAEITGLDKSGKDYTNQLKALKDKALEITNEYDTKTAELTAKEGEAAANRDLQVLESGERQKIEATRQGTAARLAAIVAGIQQEEALGLQDTNFFRDLLNQRVEAIRQEAEQEGKLKQDAAREAADNDEKMGAMAIAAEKEQMALEDSTRRVSIQQRINEDIKIANEEYAIKMAAIEKEIAGLDTSGNDYLNKLKQLQDKEKQLTQQHEDEITEIKHKATIESNQRILSEYDQFADGIAASLTKTIMGHQTFSHMLISLGDQVVGNMIENSIKIILANDMTKRSDAAKAARSAYKIGEDMGPAGVVLGPVFAAAAFMGVMAFQGGTDSVPGVNGGDRVPAMLERGEGVVPGGVMDGLRSMARSGSMGGNVTHHLHYRPTFNVSAIDGDGISDVLEKHSSEFQRHFEQTLRRMNH